MRRRQIAFAGPERDQPLAPARIIEDLDNAAFRREAGLRAEGVDEVHGHLPDQFRLDSCFEMENRMRNVEENVNI